MTKREFWAELELGEKSKFHGLDLSNFPNRNLDVSLTDQVDYLVHNCGDNSKKVGRLMRLQKEIENGLSANERDELEKHIHDLLNHWVPIVNAERGHAPISLPEPLPRKKLRWHGKPSELGHLIHELYTKGWIGIDGQKEINYSQLAKVCIELFEIETTEMNLAKELNPNVGKNTLPQEIRDRFEIPFESEMNPKRPKGKK